MKEAICEICRRNWSLRELAQMRDNLEKTASRKQRQLYLFLRRRSKLCLLPNLLIQRIEPRFPFFLLERWDFQQIFSGDRLYRFLHITRCEPNFSTHYRSRKNYWTKLFQIWHGSIVWYFISTHRNNFWYSTPIPFFFHFPTITTFTQLPHKLGLEWSIKNRLGELKWNVKWYFYTIHHIWNNLVQQFPLDR